MRSTVVIQLTVVLGIVVAVTAMVVVNAQREAREAAGDRSLSVARAVAAAPSVIAAFDSDDPSAHLQPYAERVRAGADVSFITIMSPDRVRYTHPDPAQIGGTFLGNVGDAPSGGTLRETFAGTLGPSVRAVVPVRSGPGGGAVVGLVAVGVTIENVGERVAEQVPWIALTALAAALLGVAGSVVVGRRLHRVTGGMGPAEVTRTLAYYSSVLHAIREGLLILDEHGRVVLANDEAVRLLGLPRPLPPDLTLDDVELPPGVVRALTGEGSTVDEIVLTEERVIVVSRMPARTDDSAAGRGRSGAVVTMRDHTELERLARELDSATSFSDALRAHAHESANRLHAVVSLLELGRSDAALDLATAELATTQALADRVVAAIDEPVLAALLLGKIAQADERGVALTIEAAGSAQEAGVATRDLVTVVGNLVDNAVDAAGAGPSPRWVHVALDATEGLVVEVGDSGAGVDAADRDRVFDRGWSTKDGAGAHQGLGLALVAQVVRRLDGEIELAGDGGATLFRVTLPAAAVVEPA
ncbi:sensor histidine kinase [Jiangella muralis]|uniref:sensor histidine kinase n=1 Tax=Jiangella muralis TaxID=702383 RepID=UPI00069FD359|nr:ATP-binding protein [Jiangella muralis]